MTLGKQIFILILMLMVHINICNGFTHGNNESEEKTYVYQSDHSASGFWQFPLNNSASDNFNNCTDLLSQPLFQNNSCENIQQFCKKTVRLINYMTFVLCDLKHIEPFACVLLSIWLAYLIALLASTVDNFLVSPLTMLCDKLKLSPSTAGSTLMAFANGAPDIFVVYCGIAQDDVAFVLGAMSGGAIFMITVVVGSIILVSKIGTGSIKKLDFARDVIAYMAVTSIVITIAYDGKVQLLEAVLFLVLYCMYLFFILTIGYLRVWWNNRKTQLLHKEVHLEWQKGSHEASLTIERSLPLRYMARTIAESTNEINHNTFEVKVPGLTWPRHAHVIVKILWVIQWPFILLQWLTIPFCGHDNQWSKWNYYFTCFTPIPLGFLLLTAMYGWEGYIFHAGKMPVVILIVVFGLGMSFLLLLLLSPKKHPNKLIHILLIVVAFAATVVWLNIIANEIVSVLQVLSAILRINTAIIGLTILAVGNSAADWVADMIITRVGKPEMALSCCFSSPLIGDALGLSIALIVKIMHNNGDPLFFSIQGLEYFQVKLAWIFLGIAFLVNSILFFSFKCNPPRMFSIAFFMVYGIFVSTLVISSFGLIHPIM